MLTFKEVLEWAKSRKVVLPDEYKNIVDPMVKREAFTIAGVSSREQLQGVLDSLVEQLQNGGDYQDWVDKVTSGEISLALPAHRLDNIYRTNLQSHYNHGHWIQQNQHRDRRPYLMYDAVNDARTRLSHLLLDNTIRHIDDPFWDGHYPPLGFRCRCVTISLTEAQAKERGGITPEPENGFPDADEGFTAGVGRNPELGVKESVKVKPGANASNALQKALELKLSLRSLQHEAI